MDLSLRREEAFLPFTPYYVVSRFCAAHASHRGRGLTAVTVPLASGFAVCPFCFLACFLFSLLAWPYFATVFFMTLT
jgi:hypothetical protein